MINNISITLQITVSQGLAESAQGVFNQYEEKQQALNHLHGSLYSSYIGHA